jgi:hypothetical protein
MIQFQKIEICKRIQAPWIQENRDYITFLDVQNVEDFKNNLITNHHLFCNDPFAIGEVTYDGRITMHDVLISGTIINSEKVFLVEHLNTSFSSIYSNENLSNLISKILITKNQQSPRHLYPKNMNGLDYKFDFKGTLDNQTIEFNLSNAKAKAA